MGRRITVLMGLIEKHVAGDLFRYGLIDARHDLQSNYVSTRLRILFWHMAEADEADSKREQLKSGSNLKSNGTRAQQTQRDRGLFSVSIVSSAKGDTRATGDHTMIEEQPVVIVCSKFFRTKLK